MASTPVQRENDPVWLAGLATDVVGEADSEPAVVLIHGLSFSRRTWDPVLEQVRSIDPGRRVLALDLPGHGDSASWPGYDLEGLAEGIHRAILEAGLVSPVVVGHSMGAIIATVYGARYPTRGVVNIDQPLAVAPFARLVQSLADQLRGPQFPAVWGHFEASMHLDALPDAARQLVAATSQPHQELILGYWNDALERDPDELDRWAGDLLRRLRTNAVPYVMVFGDEPDPDHRRWIGEVLPDARIDVWSGCGHFPHLVHPDRLAELLAEIR